MLALIVVLACLCIIVRLAEEAVALVLVVLMAVGGVAAAAFAVGALEFVTLHTHAVWSLSLVAVSNLWSMIF